MVINTHKTQLNKTFYPILFWLWVHLIVAIFKSFVMIQFKQVWLLNPYQKFLKDLKLQWDSQRGNALGNVECSSLALSHTFNLSWECIWVMPCLSIIFRSFSLPCLNLGHDLKAKIIIVFLITQWTYKVFMLW